MGRIIAFSSGSGGTGKTCCSVACALCAAEMGRKTLLLDLCGLSRAADLLLGVENAVCLDLTDVLSGSAELTSVMIPVPEKAGLHYAAASIHADVEPEEFSGILLVLRQMFDVVFLDLPAGKAMEDPAILEDGDQHIVVLRTDAASIRSAEAMLAQHSSLSEHVMLVVNRIHEKTENQMLEMSIRSVVDAPIAAMLSESPALEMPMAPKKIIERIAQWKTNSGIRKLVKTLLA